MTMMHDDDEMFLHDGARGHHVECVGMMIDDPKIVLDEPRSASPPFQTPFRTTHQRPARSSGMHA